MKLVLGGFGFLGSCLTKSLNDNKIAARVLDVFSGGVSGNKSLIDDVIIGDINDKYVLHKTLEGVDTVLYFISQSYPSMNHPSLQFEIEHPLRTLDITLSAMRDMNVKNIIFPSSGGTIYGEVEKDFATEDLLPEPRSTYGAGKLLCEEIIKYYSRIYGINASILRISNVYGCPFLRKVQQGAIDIFIQKALSGEAVELWGDPSAFVRDYLYIDDFCNAVITLLNHKIDGVEIFNIASGIGHSLQDVIDCIESSLNVTLLKINKPAGFSGIKRNVLSIDKIRKHNGWVPKYSLEDGIKQTIKMKMEQL